MQTKRMQIKRLISRWYLSFGRFIGIDILNVLCKSSEIQSRYNTQLIKGINDALVKIPYCIVEDPARTILEDALYSRDYIKKEEKK